MRIDGILPDTIARRMSEWRIAFGHPTPRIHLVSFGDGGLAIEKIHPKDVSDEESYLVIELVSNRIVGVLRDGWLDAEPHRLPPSSTVCALYCAGKT